MRDIPKFVAKKNALLGEAFLLLIEIEYRTGEYIRFAKGDPRLEATIEFDGETWTVFPIGNPRRPQTARAEVPTFDLAFANPSRTLQSLLQNNIIENKPGRLVIADRDQLDDPEAQDEEKFTIETAGTNAKVATLTCRGVRFNPRRTRIPSQTMTRSEYPGLLLTRHRYL